MNTLYPTFLHALSEPLRTQARSLPALEQQLQQCVEQARQTWPTLAHTDQEFGTYLATLLGQAAPDLVLDVWLEQLHAADLFLASACAHQYPDALAAFEQHYASLLLQTVHRFASSHHPAEDLLQTLREKLFVETPQRRPKICSYLGQGPLHSWLRVTAMRTFLDCVRTGAQQKREHGDRDDLLLNVADEQLDVELDFLKREYRSQFKESFAEALQALSSGERNLLRLHYLSRLNIDQIGAMYHIHRATAARRLARARDNLFRETRQRLMQRLRVSSDEFESVMGLIQSRLDVSLHRLLRNSTMDGDGC